MNKQDSRTEKAEKVFRALDKDGKGVVVFEDLQRLNAELELGLSESELQAMINEVDNSGDGIITMEDFLRIAKRVKL